VDDLGGFDDALAVLKELCKLEGDVDLREGPPEDRDLLGLLTARLGVLLGSGVGDGLRRGLTGQNLGSGGLLGPRWQFLY